MWTHSGKDSCIPRSPEAQARDFEPEHWFGPKEVRQVDRFTQFAVASATMAFEDAGEIDVDPAKAGVIFATGVGGFETLADQVGVYNERGRVGSRPASCR